WRAIGFLSRGVVSVTGAGAGAGSGPEQAATNARPATAAVSTALRRTDGEAGDIGILRNTGGQPPRRASISKRESSRDGNPYSFRLSRKHLPFAGRRGRFQAAGRRSRADRQL